MELMIQNYARIKQARIKIDGITVIAGENNTGKSTVGKILYSLFNSISNIDDKIERQRRNEVVSVCGNVISSYYAHNLETEPLDYLRYRVPKQIAAYVSEELRKGPKIESEALAAYCLHVITRNQSVRSDIDAADMVSEMVPKILDLVSLPLNRIYRTLISNQFETVFMGQSSPLCRTEEQTQIDLMIKGKTLSVTLEDNQCARFETEYNIVHQALYIDNPFVLDELGHRTWAFTLRGKDDPKNKLISALISGPQNDLLETMLAKERMSAIQESLNSVVRGSVIEKSSDYYLTQEGLDAPVAFGNLSTGLKAFVILKMLVENGAIKEKDVLIFDEPEIHLHPQWQLVYAELIVLLQKYFDLSIVVTTHSPYFLDALDLYSIKHEVNSKVNYYLSSMEDGAARFEDVTDDLESLYRKMVTPIKVLDELRHELSDRQ